MNMDQEAVYFETPDAFREWLKEYGETNKVLWVGYFKKATGKPSMTWEESVDEALCFGWIDGLRKSVDQERYKIRFTPRREKSNWSTVNIKRVGQLSKLGKMQPAGLAAFKKRKSNKSNQYSFEQNKKSIQLADAYLYQFKGRKQAWAFFETLAPSYKRSSIWWVMSAKREETRLKRLKILMESSSNNEKIPILQS